MNVYFMNDKNQKEYTAYDPNETEKRVYKEWEASGFFNPDNLNVKRGMKPYIVYMPLPNVTGTLHMGHALDNTLQDIVIRYWRLKGRKTLWLPGMDHAGIATQYVVEKELKKQGISRFQIGREKFIEKVWEWKKQYGDIIYNQLKKLGVSADWSRARFTMDSVYAEDVKKVFVHYYKKKLLYRDYRVVNWCPRCGTSLSELELEYEDQKTKLWHIKYPLVDENSKYIVVATTRPETMLGDTAVATHPKDKRYKDFVGKKILLPLTNREIPIIADESVDMEFGTGAVKITPAHDINDFEISRRHNLPLISVINERGKINDNFSDFAGMKSEDARVKIVRLLKERNFLEKEEDYDHNVSKCYRCGSIIEPIPSMQWFLKMGDLAKTAVEAVTSKKVKITPPKFEKMYFDWLKNIHDWTVSRQIWWGHRLPVYFCKKKQEAEVESKKLKVKSEENFVVAVEKPKVCPFCKNCEMEQVPDVLDTWFSSAIWPFAGLSKSDLKNYYPGNALITARDILNLWVARMIFSGIEFQKKVPFNDVFIHGTILTKDGKRMSKSLGTGIDPLKYINEFGADATRFAIVWQATGQDIHWDESALFAGKKFTNKIWNAARFVLGQIRNPKSEIRNPKLIPKTKADKEILKKLEIIKKKTEKNIECFEFSKTIHELYDFFWYDFCDIYLEESKKQVANEEQAKNTKNILFFVLFESLKLLHPFMPFVTEAIYQKFPEKQKQYLMIEIW